MADHLLATELGTMIDFDPATHLSSPDSFGPTADQLNCGVPHPVDLGQVRQMQQDILNLEKSQPMAEFFSLLAGFPVNNDAMSFIA